MWKKKTNRHWLCWDIICRIVYPNGDTEYYRGEKITRSTISGKFKHDPLRSKDSRNYIYLGRKMTYNSRKIMTFSTGSFSERIPIYYCVVSRKPAKAMAKIVDPRWGAARKKAPNSDPCRPRCWGRHDTYDGTNFIHHQFVKISRVIKISTSKSSFSAISKRKLGLIIQHFSRSTQLI